MEFIDKIEKNIYVLHINVKTNSRRQEIIDDGKFLTIHVKSKPSKNKANKELVLLLKNKLKVPSNKINLISGEKSRKKLIQINFLEEEGKQILINRLFDI